MDALLLPVMFAVVYFVMIRPQNKRRQEVTKLLASLSEGDDVITVGGLYGTIVGLDDDHVDLQVDVTGTTLRFRRDAIGKIKAEDDVDDSLDSAESTDSEDSAPVGEIEEAVVLDVTREDASPVITDDLTDRA